MYSNLVKYLENAELKYISLDSVTNILYYSLIITSIIIVLKFVLHWRKCALSYPSRKTSFYNPWRNIIDFLRHGEVKGLPKSTYILQIAMGYNELFKKESFFYFWMSLCPFILITKAKAVEELISGSKNMEKVWLYRWIHPWLGTGLLTSHGSKWKSRRKLLTPAFHFDILKDFLPVFNKQSHLLIKQLEKEANQPWINIVKPITLCSLDIVCETTLGVSVGAQINSESEYVKAVSRASEVLMKRVLYPPHYINWYFSLTNVGRQFKKDIVLLHNFTRQVIADKKKKLLSDIENNSKKKRKALMDLLLENYIQNQSITEEDIREEVDTFVFEGHDTTSMGMSWALYLIGLYKDVQENVLEELDLIFGEDFERPVTTDDLKNMEYLERVLKESQRLYPSVPFFARKLSEDITLCGNKVSKDVGVVIFPYALHRDETVFPNPEKFDPERFLPENTVNRSPFAYIPFSAGPRNCIGQRFAIMEEKVVIANILRNYTLESLDPRDKVLPGPELILRSVIPIRIKLKSRRSPQ